MKSPKHTSESPGQRLERGQQKNAGVRHVGGLAPTQKAGAGSSVGAVGRKLNTRGAGTSTILAPGRQEGSRRNTRALKEKGVKKPDHKVKSNKVTKII